jgi:hypothetical protein
VVVDPLLDASPSSEIELPPSVTGIPSSGSSCVPPARESVPLVPPYAVPASAAGASVEALAF